MIYSLSSQKIHIFNAAATTRDILNVLFFKNGVPVPERVRTIANYQILGFTSEI